MDLFAFLCAHCKGELVEKIDFAFQVFGATRTAGLTHDELSVLIATVTTSMLRVSDKSASPSTVQTGLLVDDCFTLANRDLTELVQRHEFMQWIATLLEFSEGDEYEIDSFMHRLSAVETCVNRQKLQMEKEREKVLGLEEAKRPHTAEAPASQLEGGTARPNSAPVEFTTAGPSSAKSAASLLGPGGAEAGAGAGAGAGVGTEAKAGAVGAGGEAIVSQTAPSTPKKAEKRKGKNRKASREASRDGALFSPAEQAHMEQAVEARNERQTGIKSPEKGKVGLLIQRCRHYVRIFVPTLFRSSFVLTLFQFCSDTIPVLF
jgi:hypothetical protein